MLNLQIRTWGPDSMDMFQELYELLEIVGVMLCGYASYTYVSRELSSDFQRRPFIPQN